jgi:hypothetical protein
MESSTVTAATRLLDNYVAGRWTPAASTEALDVTNPATGEDVSRGVDCETVRQPVGVCAAIVSHFFSSGPSGSYFVEN